MQNLWAFKLWLSYFQTWANFPFCFFFIVFCGVRWEEFCHTGQYCECFDTWTQDVLVFLSLTDFFSLFSFFFTLYFHKMSSTPSIWVLRHVWRKDAFIWLRTGDKAMFLYLRIMWKNIGTMCQKYFLISWVDQNLEQGGFSLYKLINVSLCDSLNFLL